MIGGRKLSEPDNNNKFGFDIQDYFTDFGGKFKARLAAVIPTQFRAESALAPTSAKYNCKAKVEYDKELMRLVEEGMLLAVRNFKSRDDVARFTLLEITRIWPEHFGLRGLSDGSYYPLQFEIIDQSVSDWESDDKATMLVQINSIPINYDLVIKNDEISYVKGFTYPIIAEKAHILNRDLINRMYNGKILENIPAIVETSAEARKDPRLGTIKMFELDEAKIPIYVSFEDLIRYHFGIFAFTGGGKSNLLSNVLRRILLHTKDTKVIIFDISCEYSFLLMDLFTDPDIPSKILLESRVADVGQFYASVVKPREFEKDQRVLDAFRKIMNLERVAFYSKRRVRIPTYSQCLGEIEVLRKDSLGKPHYVNALDDITAFILSYVEENNLYDTMPVSREFIDELDQIAQRAVQQYNVHDKSGVYAWATTRQNILRQFEECEDDDSPQTDCVTDDVLIQLIEGDTRLICISISDAADIKDLVIYLTGAILQRRKRRFKVKPEILFVFDEAQEFIPDFAGSSGIDKVCSRAVERLLRQGRKYGLGGCIATQRIAHLNTNALQQLHTYFVGTLPRPYDRSLISNTFMIDRSILEKTLEFAPGEWLLSSYIATGIENVPIFVSADNSENELVRYLSQ